MDLAQASLRAAPPREETQSGYQEKQGSGHQTLMDHHVSEAEKLRTETWVPTARIVWIGPSLCQWWICLDEPRRGGGEWRTMPILTRQEAESEGPVGGL